jgi:hypothetical protein
MEKTSTNARARWGRKVPRLVSTQLSPSLASVDGFRSAVGVAGKTYFPCVLDVLAQGGPQLLHRAVKFLLVGNGERLRH